MEKEILKRNKMDSIHKISSASRGPSSHSYFVWRCFQTLLLAVCLCFVSASPVGAEAEKRVLILQSYHIGYPWSDSIAKGILSVLEKEKNVTLFFEYMDTKRYMEEPYLQKLFQLYKDKYGEMPLNVIICSDDNALNFLLKTRTDLFPGVPIVFCGINNFADSRIAGHTDITGVVENPDVLGTLQLALRLHPGTRQVAAVHDQTKTGLSNAERLRKFAPDFEGKVAFKYLTDMTISQLGDALRALPPDTIVLQLAFAKDRDGAFLSQREANKLVNDNSAGPVYTFWAVRMDYPGHMGGKMVSGFAQGEIAARMALRILHGESADNIHIIRESPNVYMFDYEQMNRFGLNREDLPEDSIIVNEPFSFYENYKGRIWIISGAFVFLLILILFLVVNILRRRRVEGALRESEEQHRTLVDNLPVAVYRNTPGPEGKFLMANPAFCKMFGFKNEEEVKKITPADIYLNPEERKQYSDNLIEKGLIKNDERTFLKRDGTPIYASITASVVYGKRGEVSHFDSMLRDITEQKNAENALRDSEDRYRNLVEESFDGIFIQRGPKITFVNKRLNEMLGYGEGELIGQEHWVIYHPDYQELTKERAQARVRGADVLCRYEVKLLCKDGSWLYGEINARSITFASDEETGIQVWIKDIHERKQAEVEKSRLEAQLQQVQKIESIGTLAGGIAHDFNNILGIILGNAELAMDDVPEWNPARKNLDKVKNACLRAKDVIGQILSFSRKSEVEQKPINIVPVVTEALNLLRASIPASVDIRRNISNDVESILGDPTRIHQVMINLCTNAAHAMEDDGGTLEVVVENTEIDNDTASRYAELNPGHHVHLSVSDTGDGISPEIIDRVFDPYFTTKDVGKGTGLGLSVVHGIVNSHHGRISVKSETGKGTTFSILFPAVNKRETPYEPKKLQELATGNERILFVDDEDSMVELNQQRLERLGYGVTGVGDPMEALALFRSEPKSFDLIITDMTMPHLTGDKLAQEILKIRPDVPIILCTGYSDKISEENAREFGIRKYIEKPIEMETLAKAVRDVLDGHCV
jgi:two-component system cell cycle sensor histidine kinase/response regulator CckA